MGIKDKRASLCLFFVGGLRGEMIGTGPRRREWNLSSNMEAPRDRPKRRLFLMWPLLLFSTLNRHQQGRTGEEREVNAEFCNKRLSSRG